MQWALISGINHGHNDIEEAFTEAVEPSNHLLHYMQEVLQEVLKNSMKINFIVPFTSELHLIGCRIMTRPLKVVPLAYALLTFSFRINCSFKIAQQALVNYKHICFCLETCLFWARNVNEVMMKLNETSDNLLNQPRIQPPDNNFFNLLSNFCLWTQRYFECDYQDSSYASLLHVI